MKLTLERDALHEAIGRVFKSVGKGSNIPILGHMLLQAHPGGLTIAGSDLDMEARETIVAKVARPGDLAVPAKVFADIVGRSASGCEMALEQSDDPTFRGNAPLAVRVGRSRIALQNLPGGDFPTATCEGLTTRFEIDGAVLSKLLAKTEFAICNDETRYYLSGVFMHFFDAGHEQGHRLRAVATDGHRLARADVAAPVGAETMPPIIIPRKAVGEIIRLGKDSGGPAVVELSDRQIRVCFHDRTTMVSKLIEGTFPDYERITSHAPTLNAIVDREAFIEGLHRVTAVAGPAPIRVSMSRDRLELSTRNPEAGEAVEEIEVDYAGKDIEIGFAANYMRDTLTPLEGDQIRIGFDDPGAPVVFEPKSREGLLLILMPKRV